MTDKIDAVIANIMASRAEAAGESKQHEIDVEHEAELRAAAAAEARGDWTGLKARIDAFLIALNTKLQPAMIDIALVEMEGESDAHLISEYKAQFSLASQAVDYNIRTVFKAHTNGQIDIYVAAISDIAPRKTFEFRTATMSDTDIADVFATFLAIGTMHGS